MNNILRESVHAEEIRQIWALFRETDKKFQETDKKFQETDKKFQETDMKIEKTDALIEKFSKKTDKKIGEITGKWSMFVEGLIAPGVERLFGKRNIRVNSVYQRVRRRKSGKEIEIDILAIDGEYAILIEAKSTLGTDDVKEHLDRIEKFRFFFPEYADLKLLGAVAGIVIEKGVDRFAYKNGLFVIAQSGETVKILNDGKFRPKEW